MAAPLFEAGGELIVPMGAARAGKAATTTAKIMGGMPLVQALGAGAQGVVEYGTGSPELGLGANILTNLSPGLGGLARAASKGFFGVGPKTMASDSAKLIDAVLSEGAAELPVGNKLNATAQAALANAGDSNIAKQGALGKIAALSEFESAGEDVSRLRDTLNQETLNPVLTNELKEANPNYFGQILAEKPEAITKGPSVVAVGPTGQANVLSGERLGVGSAERLAADLGQSSAGKGEFANGIVKRAQTLEQSIKEELKAAKPEEVQQIYSNLLKANKNYAAFSNSPLMKRMVARNGELGFKYSAEDLGKRALATPEEASQLVELASRMGEQGKALLNGARVSALGKLLQTKTPEGIGKLMQAKRASLETLFGKDWTNKAIEALSKGDKSVLGSIARSNTGMGANILTGALLTGFGVGALAGGPIGLAAGIAEFATVAPLVQFLKAMGGRQNAITGLLFEGLNDPKLLKSLAAMDNPSALSYAKKALVKLGAAGSRSGLKEGSEVFSSSTPSPQGKDVDSMSLEEMEAELASLTGEQPISNPPKGASMLSPSVKLAPELSSKIETMASEVGVPADIAKAMVWQESRGNAGAVSKKGAQGMAQVMPPTFKEEAALMGLKNADINNPDDNLRVGLSYLKRQYDKYGDWSLATAAYNAGPGRVDKMIKAKKGSKEWAILKSLAPSETLDYVGKLSGFTDNFNV